MERKQSSRTLQTSKSEHHLGVCCSTVPGSGVARAGAPISRFLAVGSGGGEPGVFARSGCLPLRRGLTRRKSAPCTKPGLKSDPGRQTQGLLPPWLLFYVNVQRVSGPGACPEKERLPGTDPTLLAGTCERSWFQSSFSKESPAARSLWP